MSSAEQWRGPRPLWRSVWLPIGLLLGCLVVFTSIDGLLVDIHDAGQRGYRSSVFAGLPLGNSITDYRDAVMTWREADGAIAYRLLDWHFATDLLFIGTYGAALLFLFRRKRNAPGRWLASALVVVDGLETVVSWVVNRHRLLDIGFGVGLARTLSGLKWLLVLLVAVALLAVLLQGEGRPSVGSWRWRVILRVWPQAMLVALLGIVVALPSGGPLEQLPDITRAKFENNSSLLWQWVIGPVLLVGAVVTSAWMTLGRAGPHDHAPRREVKGRSVVGVAAVGSAVLAIVQWRVDGQPNWSALSPVAVIVPLQLITLALFGVLPPEWKPTGDSTEEWARERLVVSGLAGGVVVALGLGTVRASAPMVLAEGRLLTRWSGYMAIGIVVASAGGWLTQRAVRAISQTSAGFGILGWLLAAIVTYMVVRLALRPSWAGTIGAPTVVATGIAFYALLAGLLGWMSRSRFHWRDLTKLRIDQTPWGLIVLVIYAVSSVLTPGGYHAARTPKGKSNGTADMRTLAQVVAEWKTAVDKACPQAAGLDMHDGTDKRTMYLIAAAGGGIRAAHVTARTLERLFGKSTVNGSACRRAQLFAISGVSGGSVGAAFWLAHDTKTNPPNATLPWLAGLAGERPLAASIAGLLLRDIPTGILGIKSQKWRDRAALLEDGWVRGAALLEDGEPLPTGPGGPMLYLNATSSQGCRVLITSAPNVDLRHLAACDKTVPVAGLRGVSAALLSARFPIVTPSGSIKDPRGAKTIYAADGGYLENDGLWTVADLLAAFSSLDNSEKRNIRPIVIIVRNGYKNETGPRKDARARESFLPFQLFLKRANRLKAAFQEESEAIARDLGGCLIEISPPSEPQVEAPLGWVLSSKSQRSIETWVDKQTEKMTGDLCATVNP